MTKIVLLFLHYPPTSATSSAIVLHILTSSHPHIHHILTLIQICNPLSVLAWEVLLVQALYKEGLHSCPPLSQQINDGIPYHYQYLSPESPCLPITSEFMSYDQD